MVTYTYAWFIERSQQMDRKVYQLNEDSHKMMRDIKKQLNIRDIPSHLSVRPNKIKNTTTILNELYKLLNKITDKSYDKLSVEITDILDKNMDDDEKMTNDVCKKFFEVICNNVLCCKLYAKLFHSIIEKHDKFKTIFRVHLNVYLDNFKEIQYVSPNDNYDEYCNYVKQIDKMNHFTLFLVQCFHFGICELDDIVQIMIYFQERLMTTIQEEVHINENEQVVNTLYMIMKDMIDFALIHDEWANIIENHKKLKEIKGGGKNNKIKFKMMDIDDLISKNK